MGGIGLFGLTSLRVRVGGSHSRPWSFYAEDRLLFQPSFGVTNSLADTEKQQPTLDKKAAFIDAKFWPLAVGSPNTHSSICNSPNQNEIPRYPTEN